MTTTQLQQLTTALAGRYRVVREIGRGGMAAVYLADDSKHRRQVAIKVFTAEVAELFGRDRFLREIELTAGLAHPHILPLYDSGVADGLAYYVMPFVEGKTLREYLSAKGRLPLDEALRIVQGVADALAFAHRKGIIHRDIKPENVLLQGGHALVADFGIARALSLAGDVALTQTGMIVGTPTYMSPEQTVGDSSVDARSDIYSLACLLFEAVSGSPPFSGSTAADVARRRLTEAAPRLRTSASSIPAAIDDAVARALARDPGDRFATAEEFASALSADPASAGTPAAGPSTASTTKGLVVLPFANLSPDPENEFFADGLTEEVIADLSGIGALRVISRTSAMRFKGSDKDLRTIARELNVRYVLEGSVRRAGSSLRVTAQLVEADTDSHVWAEKYSGSIDDVFAIQEEISRKIVKALQVKLSDTESRKVAERPIDNAAAYDCYLRAHQEMLRFTPTSLDRAQRLADDGLALIGENPLLLATRGLVSWYYLNFSIRPEERYLDEAASFAVRALDRDPGAFLGIYLRGLVAAKRGDIEGAVRDIRRACALKPGDAATLELMRFLFTAGHSSDAVLEEARRIDPLNPLVWTQIAFIAFASGRLAESEDAARRALGLADPGNPVRTYIALTLAFLDRQDEAIAIFDEVSAALGGSTYGALSAFFARALQGDADAAVRHVTPLVEQSARWVEYLAWILADGYALIGRRADALRWLGQAVDCGFINYPVLATRDPFLESLRGDAGFEALMQRVHRRWQAFDA
jgi:serine/threonine protein kinase/tetratricopeptide (TPR) repeat protein